MSQDILLSHTNLKGMVEDGLVSSSEYAECIAEISGTYIRVSSFQYWDEDANKEALRVSNCEDLGLVIKSHEYKLAADWLAS